MYPMKLYSTTIRVCLIGIFTINNLLIAQKTKHQPHPLGKFSTVTKNYTYSNIDGYNTYVPNTCIKSSKACPVIMFLQGGLGVGGEVDVIFNWELPKELKATKALNSELDSLKLDTFIYVMPHISKSQFYTNEAAIQDIIKELSDEYNIDYQRIYLTGLSRGGHGTWGLASRLPNIFAAIAPIAGGSHGITDYKNLTNIPILTAHNKADRVVNYERTKNTVQKIEDLSGKTFQVTNTIKDINHENNSLIFVSNNDEEKGHNAWTEV